MVEMLATGWVAGGLCQSIHLEARRDMGPRVRDGRWSVDAQGFLDAVRSGDVAAVQSLIKADPKLSGAKAEGGETAVLLAVYHGHAEVAEALAGDGSRLDVFEAAALGAQARLTDLLAGDPGLVHAYSGDGWTALHLAAFFGQEAAVRLLLEAGANLEARARNGQDNMPLHAATAAQRRDVVEILVRNGSDLEARNAQGMTPLHMAAYAGDIEMASLFCEFGARLDARDIRGRTPLALAIEQGEEDAAAWLRERGAAV